MQMEFEGYVDGQWSGEPGAERMKSSAEVRD
jgi:hypothetical protein